MRDGVGVAVTRPPDDDAALAAALAAIGLRAVLTPLLYIVPLDVAPLAERVGAERVGAERVGAERVGDPAAYDWLVCTSRHGVEALVSACARAGRAPASLPVRWVGAVGSGTAMALERAGFRVDLVPHGGDAAHLAQAVIDAAPSQPGGKASEAVTPRRVLFPRAQAAREDLPRLLRTAGWVVDDVPCYETHAFAPGGALLADAIRGGNVAAVTLTSGSAARAFAALVPPVLWTQVRIVSIGPTTTSAARAAGLSISGEAHPPGMDALAAAARRVLHDTLTHA